MAPQVVEQSPRVGAFTGEDHQPIGPYAGDDDESDWRLQHGGVEATQPGGIRKRAGVAGESSSECGGGFGVERAATRGVDRESVTAQQHDSRDVGAVGEGPHRLSQTVQTTPSAGGVKKVSAT